MLIKLKTFVSILGVYILMTAFLFIICDVGMWKIVFINLKIFDLGDKRFTNTLGSSVNYNIYNLL